MAGMGDSLGEGGDGGLNGNRFNTGFQTHFGGGNVDSGYKEKHGAGYDDQGNVKTRLASQMAGFHYDPVTGTLAQEEEVLGGGGGFLGGYKDAIPGNFPRSYRSPADDRDFIAMEGSARTHHVVGPNASTSTRAGAPAGPPAGEVADNGATGPPGVGTDGSDGGLASEALPEAAGDVHAAGPAHPQ
eukprot:jgi/Botrbrau1/11014/Bobra.101_1s0012.1